MMTLDKQNKLKLRKYFLVLLLVSFVSLVFYSCKSSCNCPAYSLHPTTFPQKQA